MSVKFDFSGHRYIVTGATSGIGRKIAEDLINAGADILAIGRRAKKLYELKEKWQDKVEISVTDVTRFEDLNRGIKKYTEKGKVDGSLHAAGINKFTPLRVFNWEDAENIIKTSLYAGIELIRILSSKKMCNDNSSHILLSSVAANEGPLGFTAYAAAKSGILGAVRPMALELASKGIRVNAISPGWIKTELTKSIEPYYPLGIDEIIKAHPLGIGTVDDVSNLAMFLLSKESKWITGANIVIDGGYSLK